MVQPQIDILLATCNGEAFIAEQLDSLVGQTYPNIRIIVSDDGSTDATVDVVRQFAQRDPRIVLDCPHRRFGSARDNFFYLAGLSRAELVMFCDQDDVWDADKVEATLEKMLQMEDGSDRPRLVFSDMKIVDRDLKEIAPSFLRSIGRPVGRYEFRHVLAQSVGAGCTMMVNRSALSLAMRNCDRSRIIMHDWWLSLIAAAFGSIGYVDRGLVQYRQHGDNVLGAVRHSFFWSAVHVEQNIRSMERIIAQAGEFKAVFSDILTPEQAREIDSITRIVEMKPLARLFSLPCCRVWKSGLARKIGQAIALLMVRSDEVRSGSNLFQEKDR